MSWSRGGKSEHPSRRSHATPGVQQAKRSTSFLLAHQCTPTYRVRNMVVAEFADSVCVCVSGVAGGMSLRPDRAAPHASCVADPSSIDSLLARRHGWSHDACR